MNNDKPSRCLFPVPHDRRPATKPAFTLIELMVTITIIILVAATAMPTITGLFNAGANEQAYNILAAQCAAARALAITNGTYAGVHVQMADNSEYAGNAGRCYTAIVIYNSTAHTFDLADGYQPRPLPGTMAFGQISDTYVTTGNYRENLEDEDDLKAFANFTIIFNPSGEVVTNVEGSNVVFNPSTAALFAAQNATTYTDAELWRAPPVQTGILAVTIFDYKVLNVKVNESGDAAATYLDEYGQFLALNLYTGQFFHRE